MGGASSQVTQRVPSDTTIPPESAFTFVIDGEPITVYTHSYLGFGGEQGREALNRALGQGRNKRFPDILEDPCLNNGLTYSRGNDSSTQHTSRGDVYDGVDTAQVDTLSFTLFHSIPLLFLFYRPTASIRPGFL